MDPKLSLFFALLCASFLTIYDALPQTGSNGNGCVVIQMKDKTSMPCIFPFTWNKTVYNECATEIDSGKLWCSTRVNRKGVHVVAGGYWGYCEDCDQIGSRMLVSEEQEVEVPLKALSTEISAASVEEKKQLLLKIAEEPSDDIINEENVVPKSTLSSPICTCTEESACSWLQDLIKFRNSNPNDVSFKNQFDWIHNFARCGPGKVHCCSQEDYNFDFPNDWYLGTWKPNATREECGKRSSAENIIGGETAQVGEFPYMALLQYENYDGKSIYACGGSLINKRYVLTAAHCHSEANPIKKVILGEHTLGPDPDCLNGICSPKVMAIDVDEVTIHEKYNPRAAVLGFDIALIRLKTLATLSYEDTDNSIVSPICLSWIRNDPNVQLKLGDKMVVTGWGKYTRNETETRDNFKKFGSASKTLQKLEVPGVPIKTCSIFDHLKNIRSDIMICAGAESGKDSCSGDSGGPLVYRTQAEEPWYQVGIVSYGTKICGIEVPGVYTRVSAFIEWIAKNMKP